MRNMCTSLTKGHMMVVQATANILNDEASFPCKVIQLCMKLLGRISSPRMNAFLAPAFQVSTVYIFSSIGLVNIKLVISKWKILCLN